MTTEERVDHLERELAAAKRGVRWLLAGMILLACIGSGAVAWALHAQNGRYAFTGDGGRFLLDTRTGHRWAFGPGEDTAVIIDMGTISNPKWDRTNVHYEPTEREVNGPKATAAAPPERLLTDAEVFARRPLSPTTQSAGTTMFGDPTIEAADVPIPPGFVLESEPQTRPSTATQPAWMRAPVVDEPAQRSFVPAWPTLRPLELRLNLAEMTIDKVKSRLDSAESENSILRLDLRAAELKVYGLESKVSKLEGTVGEFRR